MGPGDGIALERGAGRFSRDGEWLDCSRVQRTQSSGCYEQSTAVGKEGELPLPRTSMRHQQMCQTASLSHLWVCELEQNTVQKKKKNVCLNVRFCRTMINNPGGPNARAQHFLFFLRGYRLRAPLRRFSRSHKLIFPIL